MLLSFFRTSKLSVVALAVAMLAALWFKTFLGGASFPFIFDTVSMPLYSLVAGYIAPGSTLSAVVTFALVLAIAFYLLHLNSKFIIIKQRTYLPALFYFLISSALIPVQRLNPAIFATFFILLALNHIFAIYQKPDPLDNLFRAGTSLGLASLLYAPAMPLYLIIFIALLQLREFSLREWLVALLGIALPWGFLMLTYYWLNADILRELQLIGSNFAINARSSVDEVLPVVLVSILGLPALASLLYLVPSMANQKVGVRKYHILLLWLLLLGAMCFALIPTASYEMAYILAIPLSFQLGNYFANVRNGFWHRLLFALVIIGPVAVQAYLALA